MTIDNQLHGRNENRIHLLLHRCNADKPTKMATTNPSRPDATLPRPSMRDFNSPPRKSKKITMTMPGEERCEGVFKISAKL